jgi:hypothetical protein
VWPPAIGIYGWLILGLPTGTGPGPAGSSNVGLHYKVHKRIVLIDYATINARWLLAWLHANFRAEDFTLKQLSVALAGHVPDKWKGLRATLGLREAIAVLRKMGFVEQRKNPSHHFGRAVPVYRLTRVVLGSGGGVWFGKSFVSFNP